MPENVMREVDPAPPRYGTDLLKEHLLTSEAKRLPERVPLSPETSDLNATFTKEASQALLKSPSPEVNATVASESVTLDEVRIETELGGVFYLINAGLFLGLYGDFSTPAQPGLTLPIFDFLTLIAQRLLGADLQDDPVWTLLAQLAGRSESDPPGQGFAPSNEWRMPAQWLDAFPEDGALEWSMEDERLRVSHPSGFLLIDVPLAVNPVKQLKRELLAYDPNATRQLHAGSPGLSQTSNSLDQWLDWIVPYICARLLRALGDDDVVQHLCAHRATIHSTSAHLDIRFVLSEHPLEIRCAGLDRDPGWVPAAGRFIRFHYQ